MVSHPGPNACTDGFDADEARTTGSSNGPAGPVAVRQPHRERRAGLGAPAAAYPLVPRCQLGPATAAVRARPTRAPPRPQQLPGLNEATAFLVEVPFTVQALGHTPVAGTPQTSQMRATAVKVLTAAAGLGPPAARGPTGTIRSTPTNPTSATCADGCQG